MAKIEGIGIKNFRGLKDVSLGRTAKHPNAKPLTPMTVVIGKNGVGKSTLFDAFGFLADALKFGVDEACDLRERGGFERIRSQGGIGDITFEISYRENNNTNPIFYFISIDIDVSGRPFVQREILGEESDKGLFMFLMLANGTGLAVKAEGKGINSHKDGFDIAQMLKKSSKTRNTKVKGAEAISLTDNKKLGIATLGVLKQHPRISAFRQFMESWYLSYFTPDAARNINTAGAQPHLNSKGDNIANVVEFMENSYSDNFQAILNSIAEKIPGIHTIRSYRDPINKNLYLLFNDKGFGEPFYQLQMSDGTLKVFAYLLLLEAPNPPPFICIEEPENGLYHKLLEVLATEFRAHTQRKNGSQLFITTHQPYFVNGLNPREVWILEKGEDGFSTIRRASDDDLVNNLFEEEMPLGGLWYSGYLDKRAKPCTLKS